MTVLVPTLAPDMSVPIKLSSTATLAVAAVLAAYAAGTCTLIPFRPLPEMTFPETVTAVTVEAVVSVGLQQHTAESVAEGLTGTRLVNGRAGGVRADVVFADLKQRRAAAEIAHQVNTIYTIAGDQVPLDRVLTPSMVPLMLPLTLTPSPLLPTITLPAPPEALTVPPSVAELTPGKVTGIVPQCAHRAGEHAANRCLGTSSQETPVDCPIELLPVFVRTIPVAFPRTYHGLAGPDQVGDDQVTRLDNPPEEIETPADVLNPMMLPTPEMVELSTTRPFASLTEKSAENHAPIVVITLKRPAQGATNRVVRGI